MGGTQPWPEKDERRTVRLTPEEAWEVYSALCNKYIFDEQEEGRRGDLLNRFREASRPHWTRLQREGEEELARLG